MAIALNDNPQLNSFEFERLGLHQSFFISIFGWSLPSNQLFDLSRDQLVSIL